MKNLFKVLALTSSLSLFNVNTSQALVSIESFNPVGAMAGLVLIGGAFGTHQSMNIIFGGANDRCLNKTRGQRNLGCRIIVAGQYSALWTGVIGLLVLDENGNTGFNEINANDAKLKNISELELEAYNSEIDQINAIFDQANFDTKNLSNELAAEKSKQIWTEGLSTLSSEAQSALLKLVK